MRRALLLSRQVRPLARMIAVEGSPIPALKKFDPPVPGTPAAIAAVAGDLTALKAVPSFEGLNAPDDSGNTPLVWAANAGQKEAVELLLYAKVDANALGFLQNSAVSRACRMGHVEVLRTLLSAPGMACMNVPNSKQQYPLHFAAFKKHLECVKVMLEFGVDTTVLDRKGRTPAEDTSCPVIRQAILDGRVALGQAVKPE
mmetsp:Transcript_32552/g.86008  ORF Transcript_32552/g.86008 Transcript_32552/m.86008 type:complete len:200 (-) Transcript_32552:115-714(-)